MSESEALHHLSAQGAPVHGGGTLLGDEAQGPGQIRIGEPFARPGRTPPVHQVGGGGTVVLLQEILLRGPLAGDDG